jgi:hypothetical protein
MKFRLKLYLKVKHNKTKIHRYNCVIIFILKFKIIQVKEKALDIANIYTRQIRADDSILKLTPTWKESSLSLSNHNVTNSRKSENDKLIKNVS